MNLTRIILWGIVVALVVVLFWLRATDVQHAVGSDNALLVRARANASRIDSLEVRLGRLERQWREVYVHPEK